MLGSVCVCDNATSCQHVQIRKRSKRRKEDQKRVLTDYLKNFERLLSLLTRSIQEVQEREIVYHGYLRWAWSLRVLSHAHLHE